MSAPPVILLAGPTASGKTELALALAARAPVEIVSVDSSQVYRGFDIGAAKPDAVIRGRVRHHLLDIREPAQAYSAGEFVADAMAAIRDIQGRGRVPLLVGGTMLYFNALIRGIAPLPVADPAIRAALDSRAAQLGWPAMHAALAEVDPVAAARIHPNDPQRIQRALEVYAASGRTISDWQRMTESPVAALNLHRYALVPGDRTVLHTRIAQRFTTMMKDGLLQEVESLLRRPDIHSGTPALRAVGYRQLLAYLEGECSLEEAVRRAVVATRQLAKRQLTWINADAGWRRVDPFAVSAGERWVDEASFLCDPSGSGTTSVVNLS